MDRVNIRTLEQVCEALNITVDHLIVSIEDDEDTAPKVDSL
ncbi:hypothetical protein HMI46_07790 [Paenibacillus alvei]|uniref:Uncharacterized protein n=1 Tax=Paenibacillus alvei TaxID=44250 RepID=A0AAP7DI25_PAEAL|nr:hypothetical protein [Paenibacillus alvei]